jgi:hypothetical protein
MPDGSAINTDMVQHFDTGGTSTMPSFNYDPSQYVTQATNWANNMWGNNADQYQWAKDQYNKNQATANAVISSSLNNAGLWDNAAGQGLSRYESMYAPAMQQQLEYAQQYATPENLALYRGQAMAGVGQAFDAQAKASADSLRGYGLDPTTVAQRLDTTVRTQRAAAEAGAGTQSDINNKLIGQQLLGQAIQTGQADVGLAGQMAGVGMAQRNQAVNTGLATTASGSQTMGTPMQWAGMGATQLQQWPKAELDSMHASNEYGALWNDINRTNLTGQQMAYGQGSGAGALAGAGLGAVSNMVKFAPIQLSTGGVVPGYAKGGSVGTSTWRKFASGDPIANPDPIGDDSTAAAGGGGSGASSFADAFKAGQGNHDPMFTLTWGQPAPTPTGPQGSGPGGTYQPGDFQPGGVGYDPRAAIPPLDPSGSGTEYNRGGAIQTAPRFSNGGQQIGELVGSLAGNLIPIPIAGPMIGKFVGGTLGGVAGGEDIGTAASSTGIDEAKPFMNALGIGGKDGTSVQGILSKLYSSATGGGSSGGIPAGLPAEATDAGSWGTDALDAAGSGVTYQTGGVTTPITPNPNIVPRQAQVPGISGPDKVPAMVQVGEGILPKRVMDHIGQKGLQAIITKADKEMGLGPQAKAQGENKPMPPQALQTGPTFYSAGAAA